MLIKPTVALRTELSEIIRLCKERDEPIYLTNNGEGELVIMCIDAFEKREAALELRSKLIEAEQQCLSGAKPCTTSEVRNYIRELKNANV